MPLQYATTDTEILACFPPIKALRPHLEESEFVSRIRRQLEQGYHLVYRATEGQVHSVAGFRFHDTLAWGRIIYIDDLVTLPESRGKGHAGVLLDAIIALAREQNCDAVHLDSGPQRHDAHRLYLNHGFRIGAHHFNCDL